MKKVTWAEACAMSRSLTNQLPPEFALGEKLIIGAHCARMGEAPYSVIDRGVSRYVDTTTVPLLLQEEGAHSYEAWLSFAEPQEHSKFTWVSQTSGAKLTLTGSQEAGWWLTLQPPPYRIGRSSLYELLCENPVLGGGETGLGYRHMKEEGRHRPPPSDVPKVKLRKVS